jgi:2-polyprenyl-3-methyl-5-hydroxy-6-metoxy-1,4-benzoquinol methylase
MSQQPTPERFFDTVNSYQKAAAMKAAIELGLFTAVGEGHKTAEAIAQRCKIAVRGARILADYLTIQGFLRKGGTTYSLAEDAALFLDRNSPAYIGAAVEFLNSPHVRAHFDALTDRVRAGGAPTGDNSLAPNHEMWVRFARGMAGLMFMPAKGLAQLVLKMTGDRPLKILDISAGHGMYGIAFLQQSPQAHVVGQDWGVVLTVALEHAAKFGVAGRYVTLPGSAFEVHFGTGYDVVLIPNFLHHFDRATCVTLLKKVHAALRPGGMAVTLEFSPDEERLNPALSGAFALVMLATTPAGDAYTVTEITGMYEEAGFVGTKSETVPMGMQQAFIGTKAGGG